MQTHNITDALNSQQVVSATFIFVSELLGDAMNTEDHELIIESRPSGFLYDPKAHIATEPLHKVTVAYEEVIDTKEQIIVNLFGTVEGLQGEQTEFTLYFWMWRNNEANPLGKDHYDNTLMRSNISKRDLNKCLHGFTNTVFELELYRKDHTGTPGSLGRGKGFLIFDEPTC